MPMCRIRLEIEHDGDGDKNLQKKIPTSNEKE